MKFDPSLVYIQTNSPLGPMVLAATDLGLAGVWFDGQRHQPEMTGWQRALQPTQHTVLQQTAIQLQAYFAGQRTTFEVPLDLRGGTEFQQQVWRALYAITPGATLSYGALSTQIGRPRAVRAVGAAVGRNPISVIVPCHRVLGADGSLTGYAGGLERKTALLTLEGAL